MWTILDDVATVTAIVVVVVVVAAILAHYAPV